MIVLTGTASSALLVITEERFDAALTFLSYSTRACLKFAFAFARLQNDVSSSVSNNHPTEYGVALMFVNLFVELIGADSNSRDI